MKISEILSQIERGNLAQLLEKSDIKAFGILFLNYIIISLCFLSVIYFPNIFVFLISLAILAGRQLGLAILMHDCSHNAFFATDSLNRFFGKWFCAAPLLADLDKYRTYHLEHHRTAGSDQDPDRSNYISYPVSKNSLMRKFLRDFIGVTGIKIFMIVVKMNAGTVAYQLSYDQNKKNKSIPLSTQIKNILKGLGPNLIVHFVIFSVFLFLGVAKFYFLWWLAWFSFYMVFSRLRNAAEHGATLDTNDLNPMKNTRTTLASWWERLFVAPNYVNYHLEHHLLPTIPSYHLPTFHRLLNDKGILKDTKIANGYYEVLKDLV